MFFYDPRITDKNSKMEESELLKTYDRLETGFPTADECCHQPANQRRELILFRVCTYCSLTSLTDEGEPIHTATESFQEARA